jgi:hypothetical protein
MRRTIHSLSICGIVLGLSTLVLAAAPAGTLDPMAVANSNDQSALSLLPSTPPGNLNTANTNASASASTASPNDVSVLKLDDVPPSDDQWADYPDHFWLKSPLTLWLPSVSGTVSIKKGSFQKNVPVDLSFSDLTKNLDLAGGLTLEGGKGPFFAGFQGNYVHWEKDGITGPLGKSNIGVEASWALLNGYLGYHFIDIPFGSGAGGKPSLGLDALIGSDWTYLDLKITPARIRSASKSVSWFDPYAGLRGKFYLTQQFDISATGVLGGFQADQDKFFWMANALFEYRFTPSWSAFLGYQGLGQNYQSSSFVYNVTTYGPAIGLSHTW